MANQPIVPSPKALLDLLNACRVLVGFAEAYGGQTYEHIKMARAVIAKIEAEIKEAK